MMYMIDRMKRWARLAPPAAGYKPTGTAQQALGLSSDSPVVVLMVDGNGRVFQLRGTAITGGVIMPIPNGRSEVLALIDRLDVQDGPVWTSIDQ